MNIKILQTLCVLLLSSVFAMEARAFTVEPPIIEMSIEPGSAQTVFIRVTNDEDQDKAYLFTVQKFVPKGDRGQQEFLPPEETSGLPEWLFFDRAALVLKAGESLNFPVALKVPSDAQPGGHYAALFFSEQPTGVVPGQAVTTVARTGVLFLVSVAGDAASRLIIDEFGTDAPRYKSLPVNFQTRLVNDGGLHVAPQGEIRVTNVLGTYVTQLEFNQEAGRVLPGSSRLFTDSWKKNGASEGATFWKRVQAQALNFAIGPYQARLILKGEGSQSLAESTVKFNVWPTELLAVIGLGCLLILIFLLGFRRFVIRQATRK